MKNITRVAVPVAVCALVLAGCSSGSGDGESGGATSSTAAAAATSCPQQSPDEDTPAEWELDGTSGSVAVTGQTGDTASRIDITEPFDVDETVVEVLDEGDGPQVGADSVVNVCYLGVDGRDGSTFDSSYDRGKPAQFPVSGVVPGFAEALEGNSVGSSVAVAVSPEDGYPEGTPDGSIRAGDTIVFALTILDAR